MDLKFECCLPKLSRAATNSDASSRPAPCVYPPVTIYVYIYILQKLFGYISGGNAANAKIDMTAPVLTKVEPGQGPTCESTFTVSFYNPYKYQVRRACWIAEVSLSA